MITLTAGEIASLVGGELHHIDPATQVEGPVEFDSRNVTPGCIFAALPGARVDGHTFATGAINDGAALVLAAREVGVPSVVLAPLGKQDSNAEAFAHDPDGSGAAVLAAMGKLARHTVDTLAETADLQVVGVTGSAGKTSTKDLIASVLRSDGATVAPPGSFNNELGHPYTALRVGERTKYLVAEMSARGIGHIAHLAEIAPPKIGVVLNVGSAHLGEFGSRENIARAKGELVEALPADGVAILNADDDLVSAMAARTQAPVLKYGTTAAAATDPQVAVYATGIELDEVARASFTLHLPDSAPQPVQLQIFGQHQVSNALAAAAVGHAMGLPAEQIARCLSEHTAASANRMDVRTRADGVTVINDSYNANPESMRAGIAALAFTVSARPDAKSWAVLGQMGELGDDAIAAHEALAEVLDSRHIDHLVVVGDGPARSALAKAALNRGITTVSVADTDAAVDAVARAVRAGDVVLVKASYADRLWRVAEGLLAGSELKENK